MKHASSIKSYEHKCYTFIAGLKSTRNDVRRSHRQRNVYHGDIRARVSIISNGKGILFVYEWRFVARE